jgi:hypothetical protein
VVVSFRDMLNAPKMSKARCGAHKKTGPEMGQFQ